MSTTPSKRNRGNIETLEQMLLMSASAADVEFTDLGTGTAGNDLLFSTEAGGNLDAAGGNDILVGAAGDNLLSGGNGDDLLISVRGDNVLNGGDGEDMALYLQGNRADFQVKDFGFGGIVEISGAGRADLLTGVESVSFNDGTYTIDQLLNADSTAPASGLSNAAAAANITAGSLSAATNNDDVLAATTAGKRIDGSGGNDALIAIAGDNVLNGDAGDDTFITHRGDNTVDGGTGQDSVIYRSGQRADFEITSLSNGQIRVANADVSDTLSNIETLIFADGAVDVSELTFDSIETTPPTEVVDPPAVVDPPIDVVDPPVVVDPPIDVVAPPVVVDPPTEVVDPPVVVDPPTEVVDPPVVVDPPIDVVDPPVVVDPPIEVADPPVVVDPPTGVVDLPEGSNDSIAMTGNGVAIVEGTDANDWINGTQADDQILAGAGDDEIYAPLGNNTIDGGDGDDALIVYEGNRADYSVQLTAEGTIILQGAGLNGTTVRQELTNVERIVFNDGVLYTSDVVATEPPVVDPPPVETGEASIVGTDAGEWINGSELDDRIFAGGGNDEIYVPFGSNEINGGDGIDSLIVYEGNASDYELQKLTDGRIMMRGPGLNGGTVTNLLSDVERIQFNDRVIMTDEVSTAIQD